MIRKLRIFVWGRILGALFGIPAGIYGIIFGFIIGYLVDQLLIARRNKDKLERFLKNPGDTDFPDYSALLTSVIGVSVFLLSSDDRLQVRQVELIKEYINTRFALKRGRLQSINLIIDESYHLGADIDFHNLCSRINKRFSLPERMDFLRFLIDISVISEKGLTKEKRSRLSAAAGEFGLSEGEFADLTASCRTLDTDACAILGVATDADEAEIKRVYRLLAAQFHPDGAEALDEGQRRKTEEAFIKIKAAYDKLMHSFDEKRE
jgi:DnaJ like chaperone protein